MLKYFIAGFLVKVITGFDDTITRVPVIASIATTRIGKLAFSIGTLIAVALAIFVAVFFAGFLRTFPYSKSIAALLLFILALAVYFDVFVTKPRKKVEEKLLKNSISFERFVSLLGVGFLASVATVIDDIVAFAPLFLSSVKISWSVARIIFATLIEITAVIFFAEKINNLPYKNEIASAGLVVLGVATLSGLL